jgi:hypothetical protein
VTTDQRVVAKQEIQEVESAKRADPPYARYRNQAKDSNTKLRQQLSNGAVKASKLTRETTQVNPVAQESSGGQATRQGRPQNANLPFFRPSSF